MLELDLTTIILEVLNFTVLAVLLYQFLLKPVMRNVQARADEKERIARELAEERERATRARTELEERLARADEEADAIINSAQERIEASRQALLEEAYREAERILNDAQDDAQRLRQQTIAESYVDVMSTVLELSGTVIQRTSPPELHDSLVQRLSDSIWELGRTDIARVEDFRRSLGDRAPTVTLTSARPLTAEQQGSLARTFGALADRRVGLEVRVDPALIVGLRARVGDMVIDSSIAGDIAELRSEVETLLKERVPNE